MSDILESGARAQLDAERTSLRRQLAELGEGDEGPAFDEGFADSSQVAAEQGEVRVLIGNLRALLDDVERALGKLDEGTYGRCEECDQPISEARLEAMPASRFCVEHASA
jgi:RNA polymerase-binding transcription factor DksA